MIPFRTRLRSAWLGLTALLVTTFTLAFAATLQAQVLSNPRVAEFDPSPDHWVVLDNGESAVLRYELGVYLLGASAPFTTVDMGKPSPDPDGKARYDFASGVAGWPLPGGTYEARVSSVGPEGVALSEPSNLFTFTTAPTCTISLSATTGLVPASGGSYAVDVSTGTGCAWAATTALSWVTLGTAGGSGNGTVSFAVQANSSSSSRTGTITIGGQALTLQQDGASAPPRTTPTVSWTTPAAITQSTPLSSTQLNASASVAGAFAYSPAAGTVLAAGTHTLRATFTPANASLYTTATASTVLVVNAPRTTPTVSWTSPAAITQGTPLSSTQLNASASVPGAFAYSPAAGTVLAAGTHTLTATFTPSATTLYTTATANTSLTVNPVTYQLTISRPSGGMVHSAGISCGTAGTTCQVIVSASVSLELQATPDAGYGFSGWTGDCSGASPAYTLQLNGSKSCGATFTAAPTTDPPLGGPYTLTVTRPPGGTIRAAGIRCGTWGRQCSVNVPAALWLGLQATPDWGYSFTGWTGHCSGTQQAYSLALAGPRTCSATFTRKARW